MPELPEVETVRRVTEPQITGRCIADVTVNFMTQKMIVDFADGADDAAVMKQVLKACKKVEDDCEIYL